MCAAKNFCPVQIFISVLWKTNSKRLSIGLGVAEGEASNPQDFSHQMGDISLQQKYRLVSAFKARCSVPLCHEVGVAIV